MKKVPTERVILAFLSSSFLILVLIVLCYIFWSNLNNFGPQNQISNKYLEITYNNDPFINSLNRLTDEEGINSEGYVFSLQNYSSLAMDFEIYLTGDSLIKRSSDIKVLRNGQATTLNNLSANENGVLITKGTINEINSGYDNEVYIIKIWLDNNSSEPFDEEIQLNVVSHVSLNLATDIVAAQEFNMYNREDVFSKYMSGSNNYVKIADELWRIIGVERLNDDSHDVRRILVINMDGSQNIPYSLVNDYITAANNSISYQNQLYFDETFLDSSKYFFLPKASYQQYFENWNDFNEALWLDDGTIANRYSTLAKIKLAGYLKPSLKVIKGIGTKEDPYILN